ncbi:hypothetical protein J8F10_09415 [Gemmata sp. G18]|uniref:Uncharacterized protein n=1 Tax=Gemmata palustris TaxID=2822762 RepID=A0ABS5BP43_9BACT|nr:hypothetical protein [Gemmata palustris]MBP3955499.1 hypothetical protein [Gemmata palustris]
MTATKTPRAFVPDPAHRALEAELLARLGTFAAPVTLAEVFDGLVPAWAEPALDRLLVAGHARELADGRVKAVGT